MKKILSTDTIEYARDKNVFDKLTFIYLDWNLCNIISNDEIFLYYAFSLEDESISYFDIRLTMNKGDWYVSSYEFEK